MKQNRITAERINKAKTFFFEKNIDKTLARLTKKEIEKTQTIKIRNERGDVTTTPKPQSREMLFAT